MSGYGEGDYGIGLYKSDSGSENVTGKGSIYLGPLGSEIFLTPYGRTFTEKNLEISREERAADGTLRRDIIATKKEFTLEYSYMDGDWVEIVEGIYNLKAVLSLKLYYVDNVFSRYDVLMDPITKRRELLLGDGLWSGITILLKQV